MQLISDQIWTIWTPVSTVLVVVLLTLPLGRYCWNRYRKYREAYLVLLDKYKKEVEDVLRENATCKGLAVVIGVGTKSIWGVKKDVEMMTKAFQSLDVAVITKEDIGYSDLQALIDAVARYEYKPTVKVIAFYMAGHGKKSFWHKTLGFVTADDKLLDLDKYVFSKFHTSRVKTIKRLFFLDICRGPKVENARWPNSNFFTKWFFASRSTMPILSHLVAAIPVKGNCLIAYSGIDGYAVAGDPNGGFWTRNLKHHIVQDKDIFLVLADTWNDTVELTKEENLKTQGKEVVYSLQGPSLHACIGPLNLKNIDGLSVRKDGPAPTDVDQNAAHNIGATEPREPAVSQSHEATPPPLSRSNGGPNMSKHRGVTIPLAKGIGFQAPRKPAVSQSCEATPPPLPSSNGINELLISKNREETPVHSHAQSGTPEVLWCQTPPCQTTELLNTSGCILYHHKIKVKYPDGGYLKSPEVMLRVYGWNKVDGKKSCYTKESDTKDFNEEELVAEAHLQNFAKPGARVKIDHEVTELVNRTLDYK